MDTPRIPPQKGDVWRKVKNAFGQTQTPTKPYEVTFTGDSDIIKSSGKIVYEAIPSNGRGSDMFYEKRFTDGTLEFVRLARPQAFIITFDDTFDSGPRFPPQKGDVWAHNKLSSLIVPHALTGKALRAVGDEVVFIGETRDGLMLGTLHLSSDGGGWCEAWFHSTTGGLSFVRRGETAKSPVVKKRPHKCTRCGQDALVLFQWVECGNRDCANYKA